MEADIQCSNAIQSMEKRLRAACNASGARIDNVSKVRFNMDYTYCSVVVLSFLASIYQRTILSTTELSYCSLSST